VIVKAAVLDQTKRCCPLDHETVKGVTIAGVAKPALCMSHIS